MSEQRRKQIEQACEALSDASRRFAELATDDLLASVRTCRTALDSGGKLVLFGNGGSASQAQHLAAEFVTRLRHDRPAMAAMALTADAAVMTSIANDLGYERLFARQIESVG
ncbi:MAG: SIS domain-containing protein, partial [Acidobacteriota bacterium]|nr:SIS domain-containing protein [Acidobacteriota bacterium]